MIPYKPEIYSTYISMYYVHMYFFNSSLFELMIFLVVFSYSILTQYTICCYSPVVVLGPNSNLPPQKKFRTSNMRNLANSNFELLDFFYKHRTSWFLKSSKKIPKIVHCWPNPNFELPEPFSFFSQSWTSNLPNPLKISKIELSSEKFCCTLAKSELRTTRTFSFFPQNEPRTSRTRTSNIVRPNTTRDYFFF